MGPLPDSTTRKTVPLRQLASLLVLHQPLPPSFMHANLQGAGTCMLTRTPEGSLAQANACKWGGGDAAWLRPAADQVLPPALPPRPRGSALGQNDAVKRGSSWAAADAHRSLETPTLIFPWHTILDICSHSCPFNLPSVLSPTLLVKALPDTPLQCTHTGADPGFF